MPRPVAVLALLTLVVTACVPAKHTGMGSAVPGMEQQVQVALREKGIPSPDGAWLAYLDRSGQRADLWIAARDGTHPQRLLATVYVHRPLLWSPWGTVLVPDLGASQQPFWWELPLNGKPHPYLPDVLSGYTDVIGFAGADPQLVWTTGACWCLQPASGAPVRELWTAGARDGSQPRLVATLHSYEYARDQRKPPVAAISGDWVVYADWSAAGDVSLAAVNPHTSEERNLETLQKYVPVKVQITAGHGYATWWAAESGDFQSYHLADLQAGTTVQLVFTERVNFRFEPLMVTAVGAVSTWRYHPDGHSVDSPVYRLD